MAGELLSVNIEVTLRARSAADMEKVRDAIEDGDEVHADLLKVFWRSQTSLVEENVLAQGYEVDDLDFAWDFVMVHGGADIPPDILTLEASLNLIATEDDADYLWDLINSVAYQRASGARYEADIKRHLEALGLADLVSEYRSECTEIGGGSE